MQAPERSGHIELPPEALCQDVELYHLCPSCGNRYLQSISIQELIDRIQEGRVVDRIEGDIAEAPRQRDG
jgi:hypothetical protein